MNSRTELDLLIRQLPGVSEVTFEKGHILYSHHDKVEELYFLIEGSINYYLSLDYPRKEILVGKAKLPLTPVGWSGLNNPGRCGSKIRVSSKQARFYMVSVTEFWDFVEKNRNYLPLQNICLNLYYQFESTLAKQTSQSPVSQYEGTDQLESYFISDSTVKEITKLMRRSPFLEDFEEKHLKLLAKSAERRDYVSGELIYDQGEYTGGLYMLIQGEVAIRHHDKTNSLALRSISTPGFVFGWSSFVGKEDACSAITVHETSLYLIDQESVNSILQRDRTFAIRFYLRLLWLIGNQLNVLNVRYVRLKLNHDQLAIHNIIDSNRAKLRLSSPLHQVPHLLNDRNTLSMGYSVLHKMNEQGDRQERHLASLCLDLLKSHKKEVKFLESLKKIYTVVAEEDTNNSPNEARKKSAEAVKELFSQVNYHIDGWDNLPDEPGQIFIYNHLLNDPYYTLPNNFQITLDSHFISSLLLHEKYDDPGLRIVRIGKGAEYGHQNYYLKLGHINVYTKDSDQANSNDKDHARNLFYEEASRHLSQGENLIISPEGISYPTEESPGPFKMGAFNLALKQDIEPLIVPISLCYFDRRISGNIFYCRIMEPFKVSDYLDDQNKHNLKKFVKSYQKTFAREVKRSIRMVDKLSHQKK